MLFRSSYVWVCGPANSVGRLYYYPSSATLPENAFAMAEMEEGLFQYTFEVGEQLNDDAVDFAFYLKSDLSEMFSSKTSAANYLVYDQSKGSNLFGLGRGTSGHADGHIYKRQTYRHLEPGSLWTAIVDIRGGLKGGAVYVKEAEEPSGIKTTDNSQRTTDNASLYDLSGRKVAHPQKGIYIKAGKKIIR